MAREREERKGEKTRENEKRTCGIHRSARRNIYVKHCDCRALYKSTHYYSTHTHNPVSLVNLTV